MTAPRKRGVFPFTAVIGREEMKLALLLNVIDPRIGGVMIMGDRGTGKSTTIRALADLLGYRRCRRRSLQQLCHRSRSAEQRGPRPNAGG